MPAGNAHRLPPPWTVVRTMEAGGLTRALAYVFGRDVEEARRIAVNIARPPELLVRATG